MIEYRKIEENDIDLVLSLYRKYPDFPSPKQYMLPGGGTDGYLAIKDGEIVGALYVLIAANGPYVNIQWMVGNKDYRGSDKKEILVYLLNYALDIMAEAGYLYAMSLANIDKQLGLLDLYKSAGFDCDTPLTYEMCKQLK